MSSTRLVETVRLLGQVFGGISTAGIMFRAGDNHVADVDLLDILQAVGSLDSMLYALQYCIVVLFRKCRVFGTYYRQLLAHEILLEHQH